MKFADLTPDPLTLRAGNEIEFEGLNDSAIVQNMNVAAALQTLRLDIEDALSIAPGESWALDEITELHEQRLAVALAFKSLQLYFVNLDEGEGSKANAKAKAYATRYEQARALFPRMTRARVSSHNFVRIRR